MFYTVAVQDDVGARWMSWNRPSETGARATSNLTTTSKSTTSVCLVSLALSTAAAAADDDDDADDNGANAMMEVISEAL